MSMPQEDSQPRKRAARKTPDERVAEIRAAASELALTDGLSAITLRAIAPRIGVAPALVNHYTPSMDALVASTFTAIVEAEIAEIQGHLESLSSAAESLRWLVDRMLDEADDVTKVWVDAWSIGRRNHALGAAVQDVTGRWIQLVSEVIGRGIADGEFAETNPDDVAWEVLTMVGGLTSQASVRPARVTPPPGLLARALERTLGLSAGTLATVPARAV